LPSTALLPAVVAVAMAVTGLFNAIFAAFVTTSKVNA